MSPNNTVAWIEAHNFFLLSIIRSGSPQKNIDEIKGTTQFLVLTYLFLFFCAFYCSTLSPFCQ